MNSGELYHGVMVVTVKQVTLQLQTEVMQQELVVQIQMFTCLTIKPRI